MLTCSHILIKLVCGEEAIVGTSSSSLIISRFPDSSSSSLNISSSYQLLVNEGWLGQRKDAVVVWSIGDLPLKVGLISEILGACVQLCMQLNMNGSSCIQYRLFGFCVYVNVLLYERVKYTISILQSNFTEVSDRNLVPQFDFKVFTMLLFTRQKIGACFR